MCGIIGFVNFKGDTSEEVLRKMTDKLGHRGPDGDGHYLAKGNNAMVGLGHRRLSIIDLSNAASQPMIYKDFIIVFNGEIYNYKEIRDQLILKGHHFQTSSDTEVILHAYEEWGKSCMESFIGMFTFVIYDRSKEEIFCVRDRAGVKPFFWHFNENLFLFGSELKSFHEHPGFMPHLNRNAVASFFQFGYVPTPHCIFEKTYKLSPGHYLVFNLKTRELSIKMYWDVMNAYSQSTLKIDLPEAINESERILEKAFSYRMVSDVPVGVFLSGGYDSTCVTALLQKNATSRINTFTIGVEDKGLNEAEFAKKTADHLNTNHTEYYCTSREALEIIPELPFYYDEPFADSSAIPTILVSRLARKSVTVALSADGGDEIFAGYNKYYQAMVTRQKLQMIPSFGRDLLASMLKRVPAHQIPYFNRKPLFSTRYKKIYHLVRDKSIPELMLNMSSLFYENELGRMLKYSAANLPTFFDEKIPGKDDLSYMMAIDYKTYMLDDILQKVDRATMSASLEGREPFLDQHIIEFAARLPSDYKLHKGVKKYILREIVHRYVPKEMMERPKMGFGIPIADWLKNELRHFVEEATDESFIEKQGLFNKHEVTKLKNEFMNGKEQLHTKIWYLLMFQLWYKKWM